MTAKRLNIVKIGAFASAVVVVGGAAAQPMRYLDTRFVQRDTLLVHELQISRQRAIDSVTYLAYTRSLDERVARLDSNVMCLRHPKARGCE